MKKIKLLVIAAFMGVGMVGLLGCGVNDSSNSKPEKTIENKDISEKKNYDPTDLHRAANKGDIDKVRAILETNPEPNVRDSYGGTELHAAMFQKNIEIVKLLIEFGSDVNAKGTSNGYTPLHDAVWANNIEAVKLLIENGADSSIKNNNGQTPYDKAVAENKSEIVEFLDSIKEKGVVDISEGEEESYEVIRSYFQAVAEDNSDKFMEGFGDNSEIIVVNRTLDSKEQIKRFWDNEVSGGVYEIYRAEKTEEGMKILLQFTPRSWNSPEPFAVYNFRIVNGKIEKADLQYATDEDKEYFREMTLEKTDIIPEAFMTYLKGVDEDDSNLLASSFTEDGKVKDVSRMIEGRGAIKSWADNEVLFLNYEVGKVVYTEEGAEVYNHISFGTGSGGFYGRYDMEIEKGKIKYADLQYTKKENLEY